MGNRSDLTLVSKNGRTTAVLSRPLTMEQIDFLRLSEAIAVEIVDGKGWRGGSLDFVRHLDFVTSLSIRAMLSPVESLSSLEHMPQIESLDIQTYSKGVVDFRKFSNLRNCSVIWQEGFRSLFDCEQLEAFALIGYKEKHLPIHRMTQLKKLQILDSSILSLDFLGSMGQLAKLRLAALRRLEETCFVSRCSTLEMLDIDSCKGFRNVEILSRLTKLHYLCLLNLGEIETFAPLNTLKNLEAFFFFENTNVIDGKVAFLRQLPKLKSISFANRRHYDCKREDFSQYFQPYTGVPILHDK